MKERLESEAVGDVENDLSTVKTAIDDNDGASIDQRSPPEGRSSSHAGGDQPIRNAVHLSAPTKVIIEAPRENPAKPDYNPEIPDQNHLSGTILPKIVEKQSPTGELCPDCNTTVSHTVAAKGGVKRSLSGLI